MNSLSRRDGIVQTTFVFLHYTPVNSLTQFFLCANTRALENRFCRGRYTSHNFQILRQAKDRPNSFNELSPEHMKTDFLFIRYTTDNFLSFGYAQDKFQKSFYMFFSYRKKRTKRSTHFKNNCYNFVAFHYDKITRSPDTSGSLKQILSFYISFHKIILSR